MDFVGDSGYQNDYQISKWPSEDFPFLEYQKQLLFENKESKDPFADLSREKEEELNAFSLHQVNLPDSDKGLVLIENNSVPNSPTSSTSSSSDVDLETILNQAMDNQMPSIVESVERPLSSPQPTTDINLATRNNQPTINDVFATQELFIPNVSGIQQDCSNKDLRTSYDVPSTKNAFDLQYLMQPQPSTSISYDTSTDSAQTTESEDFQSNLKKEGNRTSRQQRNNEASRKLREKRKQETDKLQDQETKLKLKKRDLENKVNELTIKVQETYRSQAQLLACFAQDNPEKLGQYHDNILKLRACTDDVEKQRIYHKVLEHCFEPAVQFVRRPEKYKEVISLTETSSSYSVKTDSSRSGFKRKRRKTGEHLAGKSSAKQQKQENESRNFSQFDEEERYVLLRETIAEAAQQIETFKASWNVYFHHKVSSVNVEQERFCRNMLLCLQYELERMEESEQNEIKIWLSEQPHI